MQKFTFQIVGERLSLVCAMFLSCPYLFFLSKNQNIKEVIIMAVFCPIKNENVVYLECLDCEHKPCKK